MRISEGQHVPLAADIQSGFALPPARIQPRPAAQAPEPASGPIRLRCRFVVELDGVGLVDLGEPLDDLLDVGQGLVLRSEEQQNGEHDQEARRGGQGPARLEHRPPPATLERHDALANPRDALRPVFRRVAQAVEQERVHEQLVRGAVVSITVGALCFRGHALASPRSEGKIAFLFRQSASQVLARCNRFLIASRRVPSEDAMASVVIASR